MVVSSQVSQPKANMSKIDTNEQMIMNAYQPMKEEII